MAKNKDFPPLSTQAVRALRALTIQTNTEMEQKENIDYFWIRMLRAEDENEERELNPEEQAFYDEMVAMGLCFFNPNMWAGDAGANEQDFLRLQEERFKKRIP